MYTSMIYLLNEVIEAEVCIGLVTDDQSAGAKKRGRLMQAGFSHLEVSVALDTMAGDENLYNLGLKTFTGSHTLIFY